MTQSTKLSVTHRLAATFASRFIPVIARDEIVKATRIRVYFRLFNRYFHVSDWTLADDSDLLDKAGNCTLVFSSSSKLYGNARRLTAIAEQLHITPAPFAGSIKLNS